MTNSTLGSFGHSLAPSHSTLGGSPFPPIEEYGFLSDCEVCALVAPNGDVEWMCLPRMDGPSIFAPILEGWAAGDVAIEEYPTGSDGPNPR